MEEFIEKFNEFRRWLYDKVENSEENNDTTLTDIFNKFEELGLHNAF